MTQNSDLLLVQASAVALNDCAILIEGPPGIGKSSLALALIDRGAVLIGDDGALLALENERILVSPPPNISGKLEIRHVGIADMPTTSAPLGLIVKLDGSSPRFLEEAPKRDVMGLAIPILTLAAHDAILPLRTEWALAMHGLHARS